MLPGALFICIILGLIPCHYCSFLMLSVRVATVSMEDAYESHVASTTFPHRRGILSSRSGAAGAVETFVRPHLDAPSQATTVRSRKVRA